MRVNWDNILRALGVAVVSALVIGIFVYLFSTEKVIGYSVTQTNGRIAIERHVDWNANSTIELDRNITLGEATKLADSLNKNLKP